MLGLKVGDKVQVASWREEGGQVGVVTKVWSNWWGSLTNTDAKVRLDNGREIRARIVDLEPVGSINPFTTLVQSH